MPRTRSRPKTEAKFQNAVLELVAHNGCGNLGINNVAQTAGADKVLIYRYFKNFNGLLVSVAESRDWLPSSEEICQELPRGEVSALTTLSTLKTILCDHLQQDACAQQLLLWRRVGTCPLCQKFTQEWKSLWQALGRTLTRELRSQQSTSWRQAISLLALIIEAERCGDTVEPQCLQELSNGLDSLTIPHDSDHDIAQESASDFPSEVTLPTNLL
jgi:AcrR family transcriptional regulator